MPVDFRVLEMYHTPRSGSSIDKVKRTAILNYRPLPSCKGHEGGRGRDSFNFGDKEASWAQVLLLFSMEGRMN